MFHRSSLKVVMLSGSYTYLFFWTEQSVCPRSDDNDQSGTDSLVRLAPRTAGHDNKSSEADNINSLIVCSFIVPAEGRVLDLLKIDEPHDDQRNNEGKEWMQRSLPLPVPAATISNRHTVRSPSLRWAVQGGSADKDFFPVSSYVYAVMNDWKNLKTLHFFRCHIYFNSTRRP